MELEEKHLFTFPFDEEREWYYYHHLFQEFLQTKLHQELGGKAALDLHKDAAILWEKREENEDALSHYLKAEQFEEACRLLSKLGRELIKEGRLQLINSYVKKIPDSYLDKEPWVQFTQARVLEFSGKPHEAIRAYNRAYESFRREKSQKGVGLCLNALGYNYYLTGDFQRAEKRLKELLKQVQGNPRLCIDILGNLIFISSHLGKMTVADQYFDKAMSLLAELNEDSLLAWLYFNQGFRYGVSGDLVKALKIGERAKEICESLGLYRLLALTYNLMSWSSYYLGHFSKGIANAVKGMEIVKERGFRDSPHAWLLIDSGLNAIALGNISEAIDDGKEGLIIFQDLGSNWGQAWAYHVLQRAYQKSGDPVAAEECGRSGLEVIEGLTLPLDEGYLKGSLAEFFLEQGQGEDAQPLLEDAEKKLKQSKLNISRVYLWHARYYWEQRQKEIALSKLLSGLQLCEANQYDIWVVSEKHWITPLLVEIFAQGEMQGYLQRIIEKMGPYSLKELALLQKNKNPQTRKAASNIIDELQKTASSALRVHCLGKFRVFRGDEEISAERWKSKTAKTLFKFLLYKRPRGYLTREILMELLWPEQDPRKTANRLRVALTSLRKTLEPELLRGSPSAYLLRDGDSYKLSLGDGGWVDFDEFRQELKLAGEEKDPEKSISHYLNAEGVYHGDFLEEDPYIEWCAEEREKLKEEYLDLLVKIMDHFEKKADYPRCIEYARKYLEVDKYAENIYQQLMKCYSLTGNRTMVARTFERCKENIVNELNCPLSRETEELYKTIVSI
jgi:DNA-binding SARP family transcriptional activator